MSPQSDPTRVAGRNPPGASIVVTRPRREVLWKRRKVGAVMKQPGPLSAQQQTAPDQAFTSVPPAGIEPAHTVQETDSGQFCHLGIVAERQC
jgi:hypothetical protein